MSATTQPADTPTDAPTDTPTDTLTGATVLVVGGRSGIGSALARHLRDAGATPVIAGRHPDPDATDRAVRLDLADEDSIASAARELGPVDHVVSLAADHANGPVTDLDADAVRAAFDAKVVGPILLAKHLTVRPGGSFVLFSGVAAWRPAPGLAVMATTNGAVAFLAETARSNPVGRVGTVDDVAAATLALLRHGFVTGTVAHVDGGGRLV